MTSRIEEQLVDEMILAYIDWRETSRLVDDAYHAWAGSIRGSAGGAFARYTAALNTEEIAADVYADVVRRLRIVMIGHSDRHPSQRCR
jgi:hypothetical protein